MFISSPDLSKKEVRSVKHSISNEDLKLKMRRDNICDNKSHSFKSEAGYRILRKI